MLVLLTSSLTARRCVLVSRTYHSREQASHSQIHTHKIYLTRNLQIRNTNTLTNTRSTINLSHYNYSNPHNNNKQTNYPNTRTNCTSEQRIFPLSFVLPHEFYLEISLALDARSKTSKLPLPGELTGRGQLPASAAVRAACGAFLHRYLLRARSSKYTCIPISRRAIHTRIIIYPRSLISIPTSHFHT